MEIAFHSRLPTMTQAFLTLGERIAFILIDEHYSSSQTFAPLTYVLLTLDLRLGMSFIDASMNETADNLTYKKQHWPPPIIISLDLKQTGPLQ